MSTYREEYAELCRQLDEEMNKLHDAYAEYKANKTPELRKKCYDIGANISDLEWTLNHNYSNLYHAPRRDEETSYSYLTH